MGESRASKRRKVSDVRAEDKDQDGKTRGNGRDVYSPPSSSPAATDKQNGEEPSAMDIDGQNDGSAATVTPTRTSRRRKTAAAAVTADGSVNGTHDENNNDETATSSRNNLRSSGRQRRAPKRFEDDVFETRRTTRSSRKAAATPSNETRTTRSARKDSQKPAADNVNGEEEGGGSPTPKTTLARRRSKRAAVRFDAVENDNSQDSTSKDEATNGLVSGEADQEDGDDDDAIAMQLQQDLVQHDDLVGPEEVTVTADPLPDYVEQFQALCQGGLQGELRVLSKIVLEKLTGKRLVPLKGLQNEYQKVHQLIEHTVTAGEGNSMLLLGSRGCGKTTMVESIISSLRKKHKDDFHVVRLNGFLHTDDRLALREIWRQLGRETNTEDEAAKISSYADTMATLLALLSHPEELFGPSQNPDAVATAKSVVIILDEFDLFASHSRQTLLYNLFDIAQARKAPLAVIGLTTKVDVTETLEKRVKSRFSHRYVFLPLPRTFETFSDVCLSGLGLEDDEVLEGHPASDGKPSVTEDASVMKSEGWTTLMDGWRAYLKGLWDDKDFQSHLKHIYHQTKSPKEFFSSALLPLSSMHHSTYQASDNNEAVPLSIPVPKSFTSHSLSCPDPAPLPFPPSTTVSGSASSLPLSLLLAATRLTALHDPGLDISHPQSLAPLAISFPAAYAEYVRLLTSAKASASASGAAATPGRVWGRDVAREAWEKLVSWGVVVPVGGGGGSADGRMFRVEVSFEEVAELVGAGGALGKWWRDG